MQSHTMLLSKLNFQIDEQKEMSIMDAQDQMAEREIDE